MKNLFYYLVFIFFIMLSCKDENVNHVKKENIIELKKIDNPAKVKLLCDEIIRKVVESSDLDLEIYKDYFVRIEEIKNDSINIQVYFENNLSDNPNEEQIVESTIAWLLFLPNENKLLNITADPENPTVVKYKYNNLKSICESCKINEKDNISKKINSLNKKEEDCKDIALEMGSGQVCILNSININKAYSNIIKNEEVEDVEYFLTEIPLKNQIVNVNKNGLMSIEYKIKDNKVDIVMSYEGGVTKISLEKNDLNVKRSIFYYAD